jgi:hypothetical protein
MSLEDMKIRSSGVGRAREPFYTLPVCIVPSCRCARLRKDLRSGVALARRSPPQERVKASFLGIGLVIAALAADLHLRLRAALFHAAQPPS